MDMNAEAMRQGIKNGAYPLRIVEGRQRKHIEGTKEFEQKRRQMHKLSPGSKPAILIADASELVKRYKGSGDIFMAKGSICPQEHVDTGSIVGRTWVKSLQKYVDTERIRIVYSKDGVHIVPINDQKWRML